MGLNVGPWQVSQEEETLNLEGTVLNLGGDLMGSDCWGLLNYFS